MSRQPPPRNEFNRLCERAGLTPPDAARLLSLSERTIARYVAGEAQPSALALRVLHEAGRDVEAQPSRFRFIDLFAGIGGLRIGFQAIGGHCVFTSEWDVNARKTYAINFRDNHELSGDVREFSAEPELVPDFDVLLGGFPCQPFSIAGVSKKNALGRPHGFLDDTQGTLFFDTAKILAHHRPVAFVLENVKNLKSHDKGRTFATIMNVLANELGYHVQTRIISAEHWVPQKRERIFIVGFREPTGFDLNALELPQTRPTLGDILLPHDEVDDKYTLTPRLWDYLQNYRDKHAARGNGFGYSLFGPDDVARTLSARYYKDGSEILIAQPGKRPRRLTPQECARLMGFERGERQWRIPVSDTQAYRQFGNAVVAPVVEFLARAMQPWLEQALAQAREAPGATSTGVSRCAAR